MQYVKPLSMSMTSRLQLSRFSNPLVAYPQLYKSIVGPLQCMTITRPRISCIVNKVCQFTSNPQKAHWKVVKRILRYLRGTLNYGLHFETSTVLELAGFCDGDQGSNPSDRCSISSFCVYLRSNLITWNSTKQYTILKSNTKVEYWSLTNLVEKLFRFNHYLQSLEFIYHNYQ